MRIPGLRGSLEASWEGPYTVVDKLSRVNYRVEDSERARRRVVHINNLKTYKIPKAEVNAICAVAEEDVESSIVMGKKCVLTSEICEDYDEEGLDRVIEKYDDVFKDKPGRCTVGKCTIEIEPGTEIVNKRPYQLPSHIKEAVTEDIRKLQSNGIIMESNSDWCSPLVPVKKPDGSVRLCVDFRALNAVTPLKRYWLLSLQEILEKAGNCRVLSKLDLTAGFHQIEMDNSSSDMTTFISPIGKFKFLRMPFGLKNAPAIFQRTIEQVLRPVRDSTCNYIDDVIIFSNSWEEHLVHLEGVLECIRKAGLTIKRKKCEFGRKYMTYLGHLVGCGRLAVPESRVMAMRKYGKPRTKKQLRAFLGSVGYYRQFVKGFASMSSKLTPATSLSAPKTISWTGEMEEAFNDLRVSLCNSVVLNVPSVGENFVLYTDASGGGVGACLHVRRKDQELPVAFFSRQLQGVEKNYSVTELESLAIVAAIKHFEFYLYGAPVTVFTDHRACVSLLTSPHLNRRLKRFALSLQGQAMQIVYRPGKSNGNADGLSRQDWDDEEDSTQSEAGLGVDQMPPTGGILGGGGAVGPPSSRPVGE